MAYVLLCSKAPKSLILWIQTASVYSLHVVMQCFQFYIPLIWTGHIRFLFRRWTQEISKGNSGCQEDQIFSFENGASQCYKIRWGNRDSAFSLLIYNLDTRSVLILDYVFFLQMYSEMAKADEEKERKVELLRKKTALGGLKKGMQTNNMHK